MNTGAKLGAFGLAVAVTFAGALAVGAAVGPINVGGAGASMTVAGSPRGLSVAVGGYRLIVESDSVAATAPSLFALRVVDDRGTAVTRFQGIDGWAMHVMVVSRNLVDFLHLHPAVDDAGQWTLELPALAPGSYRMFAEFQPAGAGVVGLGVDIGVPGEVLAVAVPEPSPDSVAGDHLVTLSGTPRVGDSELDVTVTLDGNVVAPVAPALVAVRKGDLAYVRGRRRADSGPDAYAVAFPTAGTYRIFYDFLSDGLLRTAAFTVVVPDGPSPGGMSMPMSKSTNEGR